MDRTTKFSIHRDVNGVMDKGLPVVDCVVPAHIKKLAGSRLCTSGIIAYQI